MLETPVQQRIREAAAQLGLLLWRNNVGACIDDTGRLIRYGLANDSAQMNKLVKSSDLIGIRPVIITADMVGMIIGVFIAIESKKSDWIKQPGDDRATAQERWLQLVRGAGGLAGFARSVDEFKEIAKL